MRGDLVLKVERARGGAYYHSGTRAEAMSGHNQGMDIIPRIRDGCDERSALRPPGVDP